MRAWAIIIVLALVCAGALLGYNLIAADGYLRVRAMRQDVARLEQEHANLQNELERLRQEIRALEAGGKYRQKVIREELGYVRDDELIVDLGQEAPQ